MLASQSIVCSCCPWLAPGPQVAHRCLIILCRQSTGTFSFHPSPWVVPLHAIPWHLSLLYWGLCMLLPVWYVCVMCVHVCVACVRVCVECVVCACACVWYTCVVFVLCTCVWCVCMCACVVYTHVRAMCVPCACVRVHVGWRRAEVAGDWPVPAH